MLGYDTRRPLGRPGIIDGYRRGIKRPWLYFVAGLYTSCAFAYAFHFATSDRVHRQQKALTTV